MRHLKSRVAYGVITFAVMIAGMSVRHLRSFFAGSVNLWIGDLIWAAMIYFGCRLLLPAWSVRRAVFAALAFSCAIEFSQLYHAPWIDSIRHTRLGALVLGFGFLWTDLIAYAGGILLAALIDLVFIRKG